MKYEVISTSLFSIFLIFQIYAPGFQNRLPMCCTRCNEEKYERLAICLSPQHQFGLVQLLPTTVLDDSQKIPMRSISSVGPKRDHGDATEFCFAA